LSYQGGAVLQTTQSHAVFVNCDAACFGYPMQFLSDLGKSEMIHVTDQYVGTDDNHRYTDASMEGAEKKRRRVIRRIAFRHCRVETHDFSDIGHVLFSVEPYQNVPGCSVGTPSPNGVVVDSQASVLSHEMFETITDPDGTAWWI
jgi:hypothetical protein